MQEFALAPTVAEIRAKLKETRLPEDPLAVDTREFERRLPVPLLTRLTGALTPAAVLIPIVERHDSLDVLLTVRSPGLRDHAGQISFPGGRVEPGDPDLTATALREAEEEVGIRPAEVDVAGYLQPMPTVTGYAVTPVVGLVHRDFELRIDPTEVAEAFEVPLAFLLDPANEVHSERDVSGVAVPVITFEYGRFRIWGATATMVVALRKILS